MIGRECRSLEGGHQLGFNLCGACGGYFGERMQSLRQRRSRVSARVRNKNGRLRAGQTNHHGRSHGKPN